MRKAEVKAAYDALAEAINKVLEVEEYQTSRDADGSEIPLLTTDWLVICAQRAYRSDGDTNFGIVRLEGPAEGIPWHHLLGLLDAARLQAHRQFNDSKSEDED